MNLTCVAKCLTVKKKTKAQMFQNVQVGDIIEFTLPLQPVGSKRGIGGTYASFVKCVNKRTNEETQFSLNQFGLFLYKCFEWKQMV